METEFLTSVSHYSFLNLVISICRYKFQVPSFTSGAKRWSINFRVRDMEHRTVNCEL
jgi:hypothetical protein